ncbi:hypothetical protein A2U01_0097020, partial [Trifolium medium]|nr:hypothetical protein [Trifolium medium]
AVTSICATRQMNLRNAQQEHMNMRNAPYESAQRAINRVLILPQPL